MYFEGNILSAVTTNQTHKKDPPSVTPSGRCNFPDTPVLYLDPAEASNSASPPAAQQNSDVHVLIV